MTNKILSIVLFLVSLSACTSSTLKQPSYYILQTVPEAQEPEHQSAPKKINAGKTVTIKVKPITLAKYLKSSNVVMQISEHKLYFSPLHLWAEPLAQGIEKTLINTLNEDSNQYYFLNSNIDLKVGHSQQTPELGINIEHFLIIDGSSAVLTGKYYFTHKQEVKMFEFREPLEQNGYPHAVKKMTLLLERLSNEIASSVNN